MKKEYCSYWLRRGECDYQQQGKNSFATLLLLTSNIIEIGCLYKHEMPQDRAILAKLGLRDIPRWYREKHGLISFHGYDAASFRRGASHVYGSDPPHAGIQSGTAPRTPGRRYTTSGNGEGPSMTASTQRQVAAGSSVLASRQIIGARKSVATTRSAAANEPSSNKFVRSNTVNPGNYRQATNFDSSRKIDLLSHDPLPDYPALNPTHVRSDSENSGHSGGKVAHETMANGGDSNMENLLPEFAPLSPPAKLPFRPHPEAVAGSLPSTIGSALGSIASGANNVRPQQQSQKRKQTSRKLYQPRRTSNAPKAASFPGTGHDTEPTVKGIPADSPLHEYMDMSAHSTSSVSSRATSSSANSSADANGKAKKMKMDADTNVAEPEPTPKAGEPISETWGARNYTVRALLQPGADEDVFGLGIGEI